MHLKLAWPYPSSESDRNTQPFMNEVADVMKSDPVLSGEIFCSAPISEAPDSSSPVSACLNGSTEEKDRHLSMVSAGNNCPPLTYS